MGRSTLDPRNILPEMIWGRRIRSRHAAWIGGRRPVSRASVSLPFHRPSGMAALAWVVPVVFWASVGLAGAEPAHGSSGERLIAFRYQPVDDCAVVVDRNTHLMWQRCSLGQTWDGATCSGRAVKLGWADAARQQGQQCGFDDWQLPDVADLEGLVTEGSIPSIDSSAFPNTPPASFWTASPSASSPQQAWFVNFGRGNAHHMYKDSRFHVRLVRPAR